MTSEEITQIRIGPAMVGLVGLKEAIDELGPALGGAGDPEIAEALLLRLAKKNYIPEKARDQYGQPWSGNSNEVWDLEINEPAFQGLTIRVLGLGCTNCQTLIQPGYGSPERIEFDRRSGTCYRC